MAQEVVYEMSLKDMLSPKVEKAEGIVKKFEAGMSSFGHTAIKTMESLGVSFAMFEGWEFLKTSTEEFHKLHEAESQVQAALDSTRNAAGLTYEELESDAKNLTSQFQFTQDQIVNMQSVMLTFTSITKSKFGEAEQAVMDMATRMHEDLQSATVQVGKALQDPVRGITALRRVGVNFNQAQTDLVKHMVATGHAAKAQAYILHELQTEFGGSAKAAANVDPLFRFHKLMTDIKLEVGQAATQLLHALTPAINWLVTAVKNSVHWIKEHKDLVEAIAIGAGVAAVAFGVYTVAVNVINIATTAWTAVQWLLNAALTANPIGIVVVAIGTMVGFVVYAWKKWAGFRAFLLGVWGTIKEFGRIVGDVFMGIYHQIHGVFTFNFSEVKSGFAQTADAMLNAGQRMATAYKKGWDEGMADFAKDHAPEAKDPQTNAPKTTKKGAGIVDAPPKEKGLKESKSGTKNIRIDIKIGSLIDKFNVNNTTVQESYSKIKEHVTQALLSAVNDSQIVAGE